jgi:hypothetical protein
MAWADARRDALEDAATDGIADLPTNCFGLPNRSPCTVPTVPDRWYDICLEGDCVSPGCGEPWCNSLLSHRLSDTLQRSCYDLSGTEIACGGTAGSSTCWTTPDCGQDAQYGWDVDNDPASRWRRVATPPEEPLVRDNVTGLDWQGCVRDQRGHLCQVDTLNEGSWAEALSYCDSLNWGGLTDWRLPSDFELVSLVDLRYAQPTLDPTRFPDNVGGYYWSSTTRPVDPGEARTVWFDDGRTINRSKDENHRIRCVRRHANLPPFLGDGTQRYQVDQGSGRVVTDALTGLQWQGCPAGLTGSACAAGAIDTYDWRAALAYCENLDLGGERDWRLPNVREQHSIIDPRQENPALDQTAFASTWSGNLWTSTTRVDLTDFAYRVFLQGGAIGSESKTNSFGVQCVRDR